MLGRLDAKDWDGWFRLARDIHDYRHEEGVEYANRRFVEEQNRARHGREEPESFEVPDAREWCSWAINRRSSGGPGYRR